MQTQASNTKRKHRVSVPKDVTVTKAKKEKDVMKYVQGKAAGMTNKDAIALSGYKSNPLKSFKNEVTIEEAFAVEGMDNHYVVKNLKNIIDTATKHVAAGNQLIEEPDWQNRTRALEDVIKMKGLNAPLKSQLDVNVKVSPYAQLSDEELKKRYMQLIENIPEGEIIDINDEAKGGDVE